MDNILTTLKKEFGISVKGNFGTDVVDGVPVRITINQYARASVICTYEHYNSIRSQIPGGFASYQNGHVMFPISNGNPVKSYQKIRETVSALFSEYYADPECPYCKTRGCDMAAFHNKIYMPVHRRCYEAALEEFNSGKKSQGNMFVGLLLAFVVSTVILLFNTADIVFSGKEYAVLYAMAPMLAGAVYSWKGRHNLAGRIAATAVAFISYFGTQYLALAAILAEDRGIGVFEAAFTRCLTLFDYILTDFVPDNLLSFILFLIGLAACFWVAGADLKGQADSPELARPLHG